MHTQEEDLLDAFGAFKSYKRRGLDAQLAFFRAADLPADLRAWAFQLCRTNMKVRVQPLLAPPCDCTPACPWPPL